VLGFAKSLGASDAGAEVSEGVGLSVSVRKGESRTSSETATSRSACRSTSASGAACEHFGLLSRGARTDRARRLRHRALHCRRPGRRLPDEQDLAMGAAATRDLDLFHPWDIDAAGAVEIAKRCERAALTVDKRITNSEGAACPRSSRTSSPAIPRISRRLCEFASLAVGGAHRLAAGKSGDDMQRDAWYSSSARPKTLPRPKPWAATPRSARCRDWNSRKIATCEVPVLYESTVAAGLLGAYVQPPAACALPQSRASCSTRWASRCCPTTSTFMKTRTSWRGKAARPSTTKAW